MRLGISPHRFTLSSRQTRGRTLWARRRDRYEIPDWQRDEVWNRDKKQRLIDSILRGWKIPKFYLIKASEGDYLVEDGQQRFVSILEFFSNELPLSDESAKRFGGRF